MLSRRISGRPRLHDLLIVEWYRLIIYYSFPPHIRYDPDNMMCWALIPNNMPADVQQLKYFKYVIATELNPLQTEGVRGPDGSVKIILFGASLDLKGKEKFYNQMTVTDCCMWLFKMYNTVRPRSWRGNLRSIPTTTTAIPSAPKQHYNCGGPTVFLS